MQVNSLIRKILILHRSRIRVVLGLLALGLVAAFLAACGGGDEDPQQVLESASLEGVESADFEASVKIASKGAQGGSLDLEVSGRARTEGLEATAKIAGDARGKSVNFEGGLTLLADHGYVNYQGTEYEIDPGNYSFARSLFLPAFPEKGGDEFGPCRQAAAANEVDALVHNLRDEGSVEVDGVETTKLSGELDVPAVAEAMVSLAGDPACRLQFEALSPFPMYKVARVGDELSAVAANAPVDVYIAEDHTPRRISTEFTANPKDGSGPVTVKLELTLSDLNGNKKIVIPLGAKPIGVLFGKLGINPFEFITWSSGGEGVRVLGEKVSADAFP